MIRVLSLFGTNVTPSLALIGPIDKGGLNMIGFKMMNKALKASWVKRRLYESGDSK